MVDRSVAMTRAGVDRGSAAARSGRWRTYGQPTAMAAIARMIVGPTPHAVLLVGPPAVGKTTAAEDLAAGLLCTATDPSERPCRVCRGCRLIAGGNHPDLHRLLPEGPGGQIVIGDPRDPRSPRGVRHLIHDLALLPVEAGARVAIVEGASQLNEDAQNALLKTLEEPPLGVTIVLGVDREEVLLPTVRSRCVRVRLGPASTRDIEELLGDLGLADAGVAAALARLAQGRPGIAVAYARAPEAVAIRTEIARSLLDLLSVGRAGRLAASRDLLARARDLAEALAGPTAEAAASTPGPGRGRRASGRARSTMAGGAVPASSVPDPSETAETESAEAGEADDAPPAAGPKLAPAERRRAARELIAIWRSVARDLAVSGLGGRRAIHDVTLLEEVDRVLAGLPAGAAGAFLARLDTIAELVAGNVAPELAIDVLLLAWPSTVRHAA